MKVVVERVMVYNNLPEVERGACANERIEVVLVGIGSIIIYVSKNLLGKCKTCF